MLEVKFTKLILFLDLPIPQSSTGSKFNDGEGFLNK